jgi:cytochrome c-type biogenesis protein CcmF
MSSEKRQYFDSRGEPTFDPSTEAGIKRSPGEDIYVVLETVRPDDLAEVRVTFNPLAVWVWIGGLLVTLGGVIVMWPRTRDRGADARNPATLEPQPVVKKTSELVET